MSTEKMQDVLIRFQSNFRARFAALTDQDMHAILAAPREMLLTVLGARYGFSPTEAKAAWNEFVFRHVDGHVDGDGVKQSRANHAGKSLANRQSTPVRSNFGWSTPKPLSVQPHSVLFQRHSLRKLALM